MKISRSGPNRSSRLQPLDTKVAAPAEKPLLSSQGPTDQIQLSALAGYLASAISGSPAHLTRLSELNAAVSNGDYYVDPYIVSGNLIQHHIEFGGSSYWGLTV